MKNNDNADSPIRINAIIKKLEASNVLESNAEVAKKRKAYLEACKKVAIVLEKKRKAYLEAYYKTYRKAYNITSYMNEYNKTPERKAKIKEANSKAYAIRKANKAMAEADDKNKSGEIKN